MRKQPVLLLLFLLFLSSNSFSQKTRPAVFAGQFYDQRPLVLAEQIETFIAQAQKKPHITGELLALIKDFDTKTLMKKLQRGENIMCGGGGVVSSLLYIKGLGSASVDLLQYTDSSSTCSPASEVVGYMAAALYSGSSPPEEFLLEDEKKELLHLARTSIKNHLHGQPQRLPPPAYSCPKQVDKIDIP